MKIYINASMPTKKGNHFIARTINARSLEEAKTIFRREHLMARIDSVDVGR